MSLTDRYRYVADITNLDGEPIAQLPVQPDWEAAVQWAHFRAVRRGQKPPLMRALSATVKPVWDHDHGEPRVSAFHVLLDDAVSQADGTSPDAEALAFTIPRTYLGAEVERCSSRLVKEGKLLDGQRFLYQLSAFQKQEAAPCEEAVQTPRFHVENVTQPLPLGNASLAAHIDRAAKQESPIDPAVDTSAPGADMPVFIPERVINEAKALARDAGDIETGGVLIGRLFRDSESTEVFSAITAFIPARHTVADRSRLTFTAETWAAVRAAVDLRGEDEMLLGWIHSHPFWCRSCPHERRQLCPLMRPFFSRDDIALHRTVFPGAFNIAVLLSDFGEPDLSCDVFGWRFGMVMSRDYYLTGPAATEYAPPAPSVRPALSGSETVLARTGGAVGTKPDSERCSTGTSGRGPRSSRDSEVP